MMKRCGRRLCGALAVALALLGGPATLRAQAPGPPEWVRQHTEQWYAAFGAGDAVAMGKLYASDAVLVLQGETFQGRTEIEAFHRGNFEKAKFTCTFTIIGMAAVDKLAAVWGDDSCADAPKSGGPPADWKGRWLMVYQRQPDGSWIIVRDAGEEAR